MAYAILRIGKLKTRQDIAGLGHHAERTRITPNADHDLEHLNEHLAGSGNWLADVDARLSVAPTIRANAVLAIDHLITASPDWFATGTPAEQNERRDAWRDATMAWLRATYGADNVVAAVLHRDETCPHIQAIVVPIDARGHLNARGYIGGDRHRMVELQDSYHSAVEHLGLERGTRGSAASHQEIKRWYANMQDMNERTREAEEAARQREERQRSFQAAKLRADQERETHLQRLRQLNLTTVMTTLGGERDRVDPQKWHVEGQVVSIGKPGTERQDAFNNWTQGRGGGGAIDLVMSVRGMRFSEAVALLESHGIEAPYRPPLPEQVKAQIREQQVPAPFVKPVAVEQNWDRARAYLVNERGLPAEWIDALHRVGKIYADERANVVFTRQNEQGAAVGAHLRSSSPGSDWKGMAPGTRRDAGWFQVTLPGTSTHLPPTLIITESPIDALSVLELQHRTDMGQPRGRTVVISTDGTGTPPSQAIRDTLHAGGNVRIATDNDKAGQHVWQQLKAQHDAQPGMPVIWHQEVPGGHGHTQPIHAQVVQSEQDRVCINFLTTSGTPVQQWVAPAQLTLDPDHDMNWRTGRVQRDCPVLKDWNDVLRQSNQARLSTTERVAGPERVSSGATPAAAQQWEAEYKAQRQATPDVSKTTPDNGKVHANLSANIARPVHRDRSSSIGAHDR